MKNLRRTKNKVLTVLTPVVLLLFFSAFLFSCSGKNIQEIPSTSNQEDSSSKESTTVQSSLSKNEIQNVSVDDAYTMLKDKNKYFLLDVRTQEEYNEGFIENSVLIPLTELESRLSEIPADKPIVVYCRSGNRSSQAAQILIKNNFSPVYNVLGGITEWVKKGYPVLK